MKRQPPKGNWTAKQYLPNPHRVPSVVRYVRDRVLGLRRALDVEGGRRKDLFSSADGLRRRRAVKVQNVSDGASKQAVLAGENTTTVRRETHTKFR